MRGITAVILILLASAVTASAQGLFPSVWQSQRGALLKVRAGFGNLNRRISGASV
jgi:hypothetical protein